jgi:signal transduction histidine kinase
LKIRQDKIVWQQGSGRYDRVFMRPFAVAIVSAVFICLILIMGIIDLQRIEKTLSDFIQDRGVGIANVVQRLSQENLSAIVHSPRKGTGGAFEPFVNEPFSPDKALIYALGELGKEVDEKWKADKLSEDELRKFAVEKDLWLIAVLDRKGTTVFQSIPLPADIFTGEAASIPRQEEVSLAILNKLNQLKKVGFVALRRKDGSGTIIIALEREGLKYWGLKVSVERAIRDLGQGQGFVYIQIMDLQGKVLSSSGVIPEKWKPGEMHVAEILSGQRSVESRKVIYQGKNLLDMATPFMLNNNVAGVIRLGIDWGITDRVLEENKRNMFIFMGLVVAVTLLSMWLLYQSQNRHLTGIVEMERRLEKAERLSALGKLAAGVAHEIRNPLNAISMASQRLKREFMPAEEEKVGEFQTMTGVIRDEIRRLNGIIEEFLSFSKSRRLELHDYPITEVLQKIVNLIQTEALEKGIQIKTEWHDGAAVIPMDMDKLQQALLNFIKNAMESITGEGTVTINVERRQKDRVSIRISDTGCGMSKEEVEQIFNPEYTTKEKGLGLGLPLSHEIIRGHGGEIRVFSRQSSGTTFEIMLPTERANDKANKEGSRT